MRVELATPFFKKMYDGFGAAFFFRTSIVNLESPLLMPPAIFSYIKPTLDDPTCMTLGAGLLGEQAAAAAAAESDRKRRRAGVGFGGLKKWGGLSFYRYWIWFQPIYRYSILYNKRPILGVLVRLLFDIILS